MARRRRFSEEPFGATIEQLMAESDVTYRELAARTGLSAGYLNHLVHGNRPVPSNDVVRTLAEALNVEPEHFREFRLRVITERLEEMPELIDRLYKRLGESAQRERRRSECQRRCRQDDDVRVPVGGCRRARLRPRASDRRRPPGVVGGMARGTPGRRCVDRRSAVRANIDAGDGPARSRDRRHAAGRCATAPVRDAIGAGGRDPDPSRRGGVLAGALDSRDDPGQDAARRRHRAARLGTNDLDEAINWWQSEKVQVWGVIPERVAIASGPDARLYREGLTEYDGVLRRALGLRR